MTCCAGPATRDTILLTQDSGRAGLISELAGEGHHLRDGSVVYQLAVPSMHCGNCIATIERGLAGLPGAVRVRANLSLKQVSLTLASEATSVGAFVDRLESLGFKVQSLGDFSRAGRDEVLRELLRSLAVAGFASANIMLLSIPVWTGASGATEELFHYISALIAVPAVAYAGRPFFGSAASALRHGRVNMDVPISLGVLLATAMSLFESFWGGGQAYFDAAVSLLFFLLIGRVLDHMMRNKARAAASQLASLAAKGGMVLGPDGSTTYLPLNGIQPDMVVRVAPGERFPVDGTVVEGSTDVDRALVTGESAPVAVGRGVEVEAGTLNLTGSVDVKVARPADQSFLAEISQMMAAAEHGRSAYIQLSDRLARAYAPVVHGLALVTFAGWMIHSHGGLHVSLTAAVSVLIITCPCALGLAVPVAHVVSAGRLFAAGILMKDGSALERLAAADRVVFDKTGTLTTGTPQVVTFDLPQGEAAGLAKALATRSRHPAAKAIEAFLRDTVAASVGDMREYPGLGVEAVSNGRKLRLGRLAWAAEIASGGEGTGNGTAFAIAGQPLSIARLAERLRPGGREAVAQLAARGLASTILSGDHGAQVAVIAAACGITDFYSELKPGDKLAHMTRLATAGSHVLMVGDGINDAPALASAHVSMAPASASDVGRMAADFVFTRGDLLAVPFAHGVARKTARIVMENFGLAIVYNLLAVPLAMAGQLNPLIAAVAMSTSSIIVVANSMRLHMLKPTPQRKNVDDVALRDLEVPVI
jgi:P-type Cu2+ transporter